MPSSPLTHALTTSVDPPLRPLPAPVPDLLTTLGAAPRLAAHLRAVHDVAYALTTWITTAYPTLPLDREAVLFGAATHDIGKVLHPAELTGPGSAHEPAGRTLLLDHGFPPHLARFAYTHARWTDPTATVEDLLVSTADKVWKGKRVPDLEDLLTAHLARATGTQHWEAFLTLDDTLTTLADSAESRLSFQNAFPVM
ncbi:MULTISPECIES: HD domain-containing protein [Streptomyces]|uniref:HD domain-containing protein n=1 Tax=Streptomyces TaxID=1883 RepID=UPI00167317CF|nr:MULTISPECIES: HD domain-containing protein [Streptomyces]MBD3575396.1 HD domain-containing protein [Streptomyces sp. KD18]GGS92922.1 phosphohydrolase [Streptomyces toxytricini]